MDNKKILHMVAFGLVVVGGINWGLFGLFGLDLVEALFGSVPFIADTIYTLVGVATVYIVVTHMQDCKVCGTPKAK